MCCPRASCVFDTTVCWPASTWRPNCCVADNFWAKKRSPRHPHVKAGSTASWSGPAKIRCVVRIARACWRDARWRNRHLRRALHHQRRHRFGARRLPVKIHPDPHGEDIGKVMPNIRGERGHHANRPGCAPTTEIRAKTQMGCVTNTPREQPRGIPELVCDNHIHACQYIRARCLSLKSP